MVYNAICQEVCCWFCRKKKKKTGNINERDVIYITRIGGGGRFWVYNYSPINFISSAFRDSGVKIHKIEKQEGIFRSHTNISLYTIISPLRKEYQPYISLWKADTESDVFCSPPSVSGVKIVHVRIVSELWTAVWYFSLQFLSFWDKLEIAKAQRSWYLKAFIKIFGKADFRGSIKLYGLFSWLPDTPKTEQVVLEKFWCLKHICTHTKLIYRKYKGLRHGEEAKLLTIRVNIIVKQDLAKRFQVAKTNLETLKIIRLFS